MVCKPKTPRDEEYLKKVRLLPCCVCGKKRMLSQAHHEPLKDSGIGLKTSDYNAIPLCHKCHLKRHNQGRVSFFEAYGTTAERLVEETHAKIKANSRSRTNRK